MADHPIFESFLADQGYALFESLGDGAFRPVGCLPEWCEEMWGRTKAREKTVHLGDLSPFLDNFLVDADGKLIKLSAALPSKPEDVEKAMAGK